ncbi:MAG: hypothetical protein AAGD11_20760 [Planctomycetota bacterium]
MANEVAAALESLDESGDGLRVEFTKQGDRFGHSLYGMGDGEKTLLLRSIEGSDSDEAPPSPPFAEVHQQCETVFLSGATTAGHWSMSVELHDGTVVFDVACRVKHEVDWLGSRYEIASQTYSLLESDTTTLAVDAEALRLAPLGRKVPNYPATVQWSYRFVGPSK